MKDPKKVIQVSFYSLLNGNITIGGSSVPVGDKMAPADTYPQIVLSDWTEVDTSDKSSFINELTFTVHFYDRISGDKGSRANLYDMVGQAKQLVRTRPNSVDLSPDFKLLWLVIDDELSLPKTRTDTHITFGRQVRYRMQIQQL